MNTNYSSTETLVQNLDEDVLPILYDFLKCPKSNCGTYMYPPIYLCSSGHSLCVDCAEEPICPLCKKPILTIRNTALEEITQKLLHKCKNHLDGCDQVFPAPRISNHESECEHRLYPCVSAKCPWAGRRWDIGPHMKVVHPDKVSSGSVISFKVDSTQVLDVYDDLMMVLYSSERFWVRFIYYKKEVVFYAAVQYIGKYKHCSKFKYEVSIVVVRKSDDARKRLVYQRETHSSGCDFKTIFTSKDCFTWRLDSEKYSINDNFVVSVKIEDVM